MQEVQSKCGKAGTGGESIKYRVSRIKGTGEGGSAGIRGNLLRVFKKWEREY